MEGEPDRRAGLALKAMRTGNGLDFECARPPPECTNKALLVKRYNT